MALARGGPRGLAGGSRPGAGPAPLREGRTVTGRAAVEIVTNLPGSVESAEAWSLSAEPVVEIGGGADPDVALYEVTDVALTARVSTPEGFEPYAVREGLMWGVYTDEVDVESVRAYRLGGG